MSWKPNISTVAYFLAIVLLFLLFFYRLGSTALTSYDEAWYGEITRNIIITRSPFLLQFNGQLFTDHPPFGFLLMVIPTLIMGSSELSVRFISAILGIGTIIAIYLLGKKLGGYRVGTSAAVILLSCMWFMLRAHSGNLDVPFVFWEVVTIYFLVSEKKYSLYLASGSFAALVLTKTLVGFGVVPVILFILWWKRKKYKISTFLKATTLWLLFVSPWYVINQVHDANFLRHHFFEIGVRGKENIFGLSAIGLTVQYLAIGIGKWYKVFLASAGLMFLLLIKEKNKIRLFPFLVLLFWAGGFSVFLFSSKTEIWHLLPFYPVVALLIPLAFFTAQQLFLPKLEIMSKLFFICFCLLAVYQFRQFSNLIYQQQGFSPERDIAVKARNYKNIYLLETFYPAAVYYSQQTINPLHWSPSAYQDMVSLLSERSDGTFIINSVTKQQLEKDNINFSILEQNSNYYLITHS